MQEHEARTLRDAWGEKPCPHPAFDRLLLRHRQVEYVCMRCGAEFSAEEREARSVLKKEEAINTIGTLNLSELDLFMESWCGEAPEDVCRSCGQVGVLEDTTLRAETAEEAVVLAAHRRARR